jgi:hypothetical protein
MSESLAELKKRVKELRGSVIAGAGAGIEELKKEIAYHETAVKSAERDKKRMEALAKAREAKIAKGKAKKEGVVEEKPKKVVKEKAVEPKKVVKAEEKPKKVVKEKADAEPKAKKAKVSPPAVAEEVVLSKNIRAKKVKNDEADE